MSAQFVFEVSVAFLEHLYQTASTLGRLRLHSVPFKVSSECANGENSVYIYETMVLILRLRIPARVIRVHLLCLVDPNAADRR